MTLQRLIEVSNVLFLHWNSTDTSTRSMTYLRDFALKIGLRVVVFIQNHKMRKELSSLEKQNDGHKTYLEIEHPDLT